MPHALPSLIDQAHEAVGRVLREGDLAIDATLGNGHDVAFMAARVGPTGLVIGFDVQSTAVCASRARLEALGLANRARLIRTSHAAIGEHLDELAADRPPRAAMFNLGYLPGGDHSIATDAETTLLGLESAFERLDAPGLISIVTYVGHQGARIEHLAVLDWSRRLETRHQGRRSSRPRVTETRFLHADHETGSLILIERPGRP